MSDIPARLLELQAIDSEVARSTKRLDELPEKQRILQARAKQRETNALKEKAALLVRKLEAEIKARQDEVTLLKEKIASEQTKLMETSDHRAVQSITREMDGLKRRCDKVDMETIQFMERVEKAQAQVTAIEEHLQKAVAAEEAFIEAYRKAGHSLQSAIKELGERRAAIVAELPAAELQRYESMRDSKGGVGIGKLENGTCTACRMALPAERLNDLHNGPDIGVCPQCRRLIVVRGTDVEGGE
jgi:predicted  nucleic acid-binding Zn-ribbon protein